MAFGSIKVISMGTERTRKPPMEKPEKHAKAPATAGMSVMAGALHLNIAVVAKCEQEAADYL
jgi:hypothetical protein